MKTEKAIEIVCNMPIKAEKNFSAILKITPFEILNSFPSKTEKNFKAITILADQIKKEAEKLNGALDIMTNSAPFRIKRDFSDFLKNHPVLGTVDKDNLFFENPLFESIRVGMKEPQYTTALGWFLQRDQQACRLFIKTLAEVANFSDEILPDENTPIESIWEYSDMKTLQNEDDDEADSEDNQKKASGVNAGNDVKNRKEIDNLFIWERNGKKYGIVIEIKFGAKLHNDLPCYQLAALKKMGKVPYQKKDERHCVFLTNEELNCVNCQKNNPLMCVVLSTNRISAQEIEKNKGCRKIWHRVLWRNLMPKLDENMRLSKTKNEDYRRFLSSLWRKSLTM